MKALLEKNFDSIENWQKSFVTNCSTRGIGWVALLQDNVTKEVFHAWIGEHNVGHILDCKILMVMDMWEHAFITDYGIKKPDYINAFMGVIDWAVVESRLTK
jgi:Fe-Mn family superoxide dismutase